MVRLAASVLFFFACATAHAQLAQQPQSQETDRIGDKVDPEAYSILSETRGLSTHRPMYVYPATWTRDFRGRETELAFQLSGKWRVFGSDFYLAYTQKSFWQAYNGAASSPFRETNYNPEAFYRWTPDPERFHRWQMDVGIEHESNGQPFPASRSWNRVYLAPFHARGHHLAYFKFWYRLPEKDPSSLTNQGGDDNPDITDYLGHFEINYSHQVGDQQLLSVMARGNPDTGRGAVQLTWSIPTKEGWVFWGASVFHGYGESLILYDEEITRVMLGALLAR